MRYFGKYIVTLLLLLPGLFRPAEAAGPEEEKMLLLTGRCVSSLLEQYRAAGTEREEALPFGGLIVEPVFTLKRDGRNVRCDSCRVSQETLKTLRPAPEDTEAWRQTFSQIKFKKLRCNFMKITISALSRNWFDDDAWQRALAHFVMLARLARRTGCRGLFFETDPRCTVSETPFAFRPSGPSLPEVRRQVEKRGRQWIGAVAGAFPDAEILCTLWLNGCVGEPACGDSALLADFASGVLAGAPATVKIIDGSGQDRFLSGSRPDYCVLAASFYLDAKKLVPPGNTARFFKASSLAVPLSPEKYASDGGNRLASDTAAALEAADKYVWIDAAGGGFGEKTPSRLSWEKRIPFVCEILSAGVRPLAAARKFARGKNLLSNGTFVPGPAAGEAEPDTVHSGASHWFSWQDRRKKQGRILIEKEGVAFRGVASGSVVQAVHGVRPGDRLLLTGRAKVSAEGVLPQLSCNFRNEKNQFMSRHRVSAKFSPPAADGWMNAAAVVVVPRSGGVKYMTVTAGVSGGVLPPPPGAACHVSDVQLFRIVYPWDTEKYSGEK